jgi:Abortive infection C-terminus
MANEANDFDVVLPNYSRARARWPDAPALRKHYALLAGCDCDSLGVIEYVKSFIESVCLTILADFRQPLPADRPSLTELFIAALRPLGMQNSRGGGNVSRLLSAFNRLADALTDVRNEYGRVAHGKDGFVESLTRDENRAFLHTGDAILAILLNALEGTAPDLSSTREPYERFQHFSERIDRSVQLTAEVDVDSGPPTIVVNIVAAGRDDLLELRIEPSRLLFALDREAFVEIVNATANRAVEPIETGDAMGPGTSEIVGGAPSRLPGASGMILTAKYSGPLSPLRANLNRFLIDEQLRVPTVVEGTDLAASLLATAEANMTLDIWRSETRQARLKIALKKVVSKCLPEANARAAADRILTWLKIHSAGTELLESARTR